MSPQFFIFLLFNFLINVFANPLIKHLNQPKLLKIHGKPVKVESSVPITWKTFGDTSIGLIEGSWDGSEYEAQLIESEFSDHATLNFAPVTLPESTNVTSQEASKNSSYVDKFARSTMLYLAAAAYNAKPEVCLNRTLTNVALYKNVNITCDEYGKDDVCSGFTAVSHADNAIIVAFRGTSAFIQLMVETSTTILEEQVVSPIGGKVGCYFANVFERLWFNNTMGQDFKTLLNSYPNYDLWLTGHSLGGALASLAAAQIVADGKFDVSKIKLYTFGQPRTGDNDFADAFDAHLPENTTFRITHARDPVPHMPPHSYNYTHNRAEAFYFNNMSPNKTYTLCADEQESKNCSAKIKYVFSVPDHLYYFTINVSNFGKTGCKSNKKQRRK